MTRIVLAIAQPPTLYPLFTPAIATSLLRAHKQRWWRVTLFLSLDPTLAGHVAQNRGCISRVAAACTACSGARVPAIACTGRDALRGKSGEWTREIRHAFRHRPALQCDLSSGETVMRIGRLRSSRGASRIEWETSERLIATCVVRLFEGEEWVFLRFFPRKMRIVKGGGGGGRGGGGRGEGGGGETVAWLGIEGV